MIPKTAVFDSLVRFALNKTPFEITEFAVKATPQATSEDFELAFENLLEADKKLTVRTRFALGDLYNQIPSDRGAKEKVLSGIYAKYGGDRLRNLLKNYGWVARKWHPSLRCDAHPWGWWIGNFPDHHGVPKPHKERTKIDRANRPPVELHIRSVELRDGCTIYHAQGPTGTRFLLPVNPDRKYMTVQTHDDADQDRDTFAEENADETIGDLTCSTN